MMVIEEDPRQAIAAELRAILMRDPAVSGIEGGSVETRGRGPAVPGVGVSLENRRVELGLLLRLGRVKEESLPVILTRLRSVCQRVWTQRGLAGSPEINMQILDFDE